MLILVLNCGSSSVKFQVLEIGRAAHPPTRVLAGQLGPLGPEARLATDNSHGAAMPVTARDHGAAVGRVLDHVAAAQSQRGNGPLAAIGHRVVHGGARFVAPTLVDDALIGALDDLHRLAPLHNAPSLAGIRACRERLGSAIPMVAVFDTAFHATLPERAWRYAIPRDHADRHGIRRYGFHGTSYRHVLDRYCARTGTAPDEATLIAFHLGSGASVAAIQGGRSVDTSMGLTPLEGLVMSTRCGDLDPAVVGHLARAERVSVEEVERWLNERSGLRALGGEGDVRELLERERADADAALALEIFGYRARKYLGAYLAALGGARAVVFTGGVGEHQPAIRARICAGMEWCGLRLDPGRNEATRGTEARISADRSAVEILVIPADEELVIARDTAACLAASAAPTGTRHE